MTVVFPVSMTRFVRFARLAVVFVTMASMIITPNLAIVRDIHFVVPVILHEIDWPVTGVIFMAVFAPVFGVTRRHMEIRRPDADGRALDDDGIAVDQSGLRIGIADVDAAIKTGLADGDRDADVGSKRRGGRDA